MIYSTTFDSNQTKAIIPAYSLWCSIAEDRTQLLNEKLAMAAADSVPSTASIPPQPLAVIEPAITAVGTVNDNGYEWLELPESSGIWYYRTAHSRTTWMKWQE